MCKSKFLRKKEINYKLFQTIDDLSPTDQTLIRKAWEYTLDAYAPYSGFQVGAAALLEDDVVVKGVNQENASYPAGLCAERVALFSAGAQYPNKAIKTLAVCANNPFKPLKEPAFPCGFCLQVILEFEFRQKKAIRLLMGNPTTAIIEIESAQSLMPFAFNPDQL